MLEWFNELYPSLVLLGVLFLPSIWILASREVAGLEKVAWFVGVFITTWLGLVVFLIYTKRYRRRASSATTT